MLLYLCELTIKGIQSNGNHCWHTINEISCIDTYIEEEKEKSKSNGEWGQRNRGREEKKEAKANSANVNYYDEVIFKLVYIVQTYTDAKRKKRKTCISIDFNCIPTTTIISIIRWSFGLGWLHKQTEIQFNHLVLVAATIAVILLLFCLLVIQVVFTLLNLFQWIFFQIYSFQCTMYSIGVN